jgi:2-oxoglutarate-Fe(II)-dependent dioxygenase family protein
MHIFRMPPSMRRTGHELEKLMGRLPTEADYECLFEEDVKIYDPDGEVLAQLVRNGLSSRTVTDTARLFKAVHGDLSNRGGVIYKRSMMNRERSDGSMSHSTVVPPSMLQLLREQNARLGLKGPYSDFLGYFDKTGRERFCRETAWSLRRPDIFEISRPLVEEVEYVFKTELRHPWRRQREFMKQVSEHYKYPNSVFSTVTVNLNLRCCTHCDSGDFREGIGNLVVLELGDDRSGILVMPADGVAFIVRPTDCLLMNVHRPHGNLKLTAGGTRLTEVLYARQRISECE